jgi:hypothetical protein
MDKARICKNSRQKEPGKRRQAKIICYDNNVLDKIMASVKYTDILRNFVR